MNAAADRIGLLGQEVERVGHDRLGQRPDVLRPLPAVRVVPLVQFLGQLQEPRPAVGPLERLAVGLGQVIGLGPEVLRRQVLPQYGPDRLSFGQFGELAQQPDQHPMAVDRGMPVERAIEGRMLGPRPLDVARR